MFFIRSFIVVLVVSQVWTTTMNMNSVMAHWATDVQNRGLRTRLLKYCFWRNFVREQFPSVQMVLPLHRLAQTSWCHGEDGRWRKNISVWVLRLSPRSWRRDMLALRSSGVNKKAAVMHWMLVDCSIINLIKNRLLFMRKAPSTSKVVSPFRQSFLKQGKRWKKPMSNMGFFRRLRLFELLVDHITLLHPTIPSHVKNFYVSHC